MAARNTDASWIESLIDIKEKGSDGKEHWILRTSVKKNVVNSQIQVLTIGEENDKLVKTVLLLGQTGSGKSLLLNGFVNHIFNIKYDSPFRLKLRDQIIGHKRDHTQSQTDYITAYLVYHGGGMLYNDLNFVFIDTPGFDDTREVQVYPKLYDFFMQDYGIHFLNCIGLVVKANETRSLKNHKKLLNDITSLLGKDCSEVINLLCTFACFDTPVVEVVKKAGIHFKAVSTFENFPLLSLVGVNNAHSNVPPHMVWEIMHSGYSAFFEDLRHSSSVDLEKTRKLCQNLKNFDEFKERLQGIFSHMLTRMDELATLNKKIAGDVNSVLHFSWKNGDFIKTYSGKGRHAHNCKKCHQCCFKCDDPSNVLGIALGVGSGLTASGVFGAMALGAEIGVIAGPIGIVAGVAVGSVVGMLKYSTRNSCNAECSHSQCKHGGNDHEISCNEMLDKESLASHVVLADKSEYEKLKGNPRESFDTFRDHDQLFKELKVEAEAVLKELVVVTKEISELSIQEDTATALNVLEELERGGSGPFCSEAYIILKDLLSKIL